MIPAHFHAQWGASHEYLIVVMLHPPAMILPWTSIAKL